MQHNISKKNKKYFRNKKQPELNLNLILKISKPRILFYNPKKTTKDREEKKIREAKCIHMTNRIT